jgi:DNA-binding CsgD family transcriptional regulator
VPVLRCDLYLALAATDERREPAEDRRERVRGYFEASAVADAGDVAVTFRGATPAETFVILCRAYALTRRERDIVRTVTFGLDTRAIEERLFISRHTVQDHLKSIFDKTGVRSRRELLATFNSI